MNLIGKPLDPNDGVSCEFELDEIVNVCVDDDMLYLWGNIPLVLSSVTSPELSAAQARISELESIIYSAVENGVYEDNNFWWDKLSEIWRKVKNKQEMKP